MTKNEILNDLREKILTEVYEQGESLIERELCEFYEISRTPIREILWRLVLEGIVEQKPSRGFFVRKLGWEQIFDIFQAREAIEGMAVRLTCQRGDVQIFERLKALRKRLFSLDDTNMAEEGPKAGRLFHETVLEGSSNALLKEIYQKVSYMAKMTSNIARHSVSIETLSRDYHVSIIDSILSGDPDKSEFLMREHLRTTCRGILDTFYPQVFVPRGSNGKSGKEIENR
ncbi:GntR family transcriptional regulator [Marispirochaeta aestuarii]|uniref:GntR family transcriptional regulator n=1 Tax=Marispirochaeta aestuarii TaxID=1963862 RepID=UPI0029C7E7E6|nr:GntR family transcriptional regulator [Marispirochaeta aestuarii]